MNGVNFSSYSLSGEAQADAYSVDADESLYRQFRPEVKELIQLPKAVVYLLMAAMVVVGVAYAIIGHLIKDLAIDITAKHSWAPPVLLVMTHLPPSLGSECVLGPTGDEENEKTNPQRLCSSYPPPLHPFAHNAFHVWDQDDVVIPLPPADESPQTSPLLLAALPYIPAFFPHSYSSPTCHGSPALFSSSPGQNPETSIPRDV
ncbi:small integral membrane protein 44-like isoform X1 [Synchiropus splendidus]|uniref:small integral membrane protein 44-like isoform X1 n=1 Tax=Synchiropus splendidus TaxID=270530 RepID=UPI00237E3C8E|nr:small integral membrane protein 44-like isoform X1 [Synchiropus splendidus]